MNGQETITRADGQILEVEGLQVPAAEHLCVDGWLGDDDQGRPRPCPRCRPHLLNRRDGSGWRAAPTQRKSRARV